MNKTVIMLLSNSSLSQMQTKNRKLVKRFRENSGFIVLEWVVASGDQDSNNASHVISITVTKNKDIVLRKNTKIHLRIRSFEIRCWIRRTR